MPVKSVYLAQRAGTGELLGVDGNILPVWKEASEVARFTSRLSCHQQLDKWLAANGGYTVDYDNDPFTIRKDIAAANPIVMVDPDVDIGALVLQIAKYHDMYCERVGEWITKVIDATNVAKPAPQIDLSGAKHSGVYRPGEHSCTYTLGYAMIYGIESFKETIAHEVVHAYQNLFSGVGAGHGGDFYGMMRHAALHPVYAHKHRYDVKQGERLAKGLVPYYERAIMRGEFASMACKVLTKLEPCSEDID
jgi:hypothetical protein